MPDSFTITILFIVFSTLAGAFIKGRSKDRCLYSFDEHHVTLEKNDGKVVWGKLKVENSGLELIYSDPYKGGSGMHSKSSYALYKSEYDQIKALVRFVDDLGEALAGKREKELEKTCDPGWYFLFLHRVRNFFGTIRDSLLDVANLFMGKMKAGAQAGKVLKGQDKYISKMQQQAVTGMGSSYEPILER